MTGAASRLPRALASAARWRGLTWRTALSGGSAATLHGLAADAASAPRTATPPRGAGAVRSAFGGARPKAKGGKAPRDTYLCRECGDNFAQSHGKCPSCGTWDSLAPFRIPDAPAGSGGGGAATRAIARVSPAGFPPAAAADATPRRRLADSAWVASTDAALPLADVLASAASAKGWRAPLRGALGAEVARVLGGGVVPGSLTLVGGDPGVGKSTLLLQLAALLTKHGAAAAAAPKNAKKTGALVEAEDSSSGEDSDDEDGERPVLYVSGEESVEQVASRAARLGVSPRGLYLMAATNVESILATMASLRPRAVVVDSIQTVYLDEVAGSAGSVSQVRECASALLRAAKGSGTPVFLVGHVTKGGDIAGPRTLEHIVDVVLYLEGEALREFRLLRGVKNRFGATDEVGVFSMAESGLLPIANPSAAFLGRAVTPAGVGAAVTVTCEGTRPMALEVQALCAPAYQPADGASGASGGGGGGNSSQFVPSRRSATGIKPQRLNLLLAVLSKRALGPGLYSNDVFVNVVGGMQLDEPATDLAICAAIGAAFYDAQLPGDVAFVGEVGLGGELRAVPQAERRVAEAARLGFTRVVVPVAGGVGAAGAAKHPGCRVVPCATVAAALEEALGAAAMTSRRGKGRTSKGGAEGGGATGATSDA